MSILLETYIDKYSIINNTSCKSVHFLSRFQMSAHTIKVLHLTQYQVLFFYALITVALIYCFTTVSYLWQPQTVIYSKRPKMAALSEQLNYSALKNHGKGGIPSEHVISHIIKNIQEGTSSQYSRNSEASASELQEHLESVSHGELFLINNKTLCSNSKRHILFIFIHSAATHFKQRSLIRQTYASYNSCTSIYVLKHLFILAKPESMEVNDEITKESIRFGDVMQGNFKDHYRNLTYKHLLAFKWIQTFCNEAELIIKVDDDTFINTPHLIEYVERYKDIYFIKPSITCSVFRRQSPRRDPSDKWYVSEFEYPNKLYPAYCEGFAYITTIEVIKQLYKISQTIPPYWIDDVYVTGILRETVQISLSFFHTSYGYRIMHTHSKWNLTKQLENTDVLFILDKYPNKWSPEHWREMWRHIQHSYPCDLL